MGGGDLKYEEGSEAVAENVMDHGIVGGKRAGFRPVLQGHGSSRPDIRVVDMVSDSPDGLEPWGLTPQGGQLDVRETAISTIWRWVVIPTPGGGYAGDRAGDD